MRLHRYFVIGVLAVAAAACGGDVNGVTQPVRQLAYVRYVNAINDAKPVGFRVIDGIQDSPSYFGDNFSGAHFRDVSPYMGMGPGSRHLRVFWDDAAIENASTVVADSTIDFAAGTYYTVVLSGASVGANTGTLTVFTDDMSGVAPDKILVRAYNLAPAGSALGSVDVVTGPPTFDTTITVNKKDTTKRDTTLTLSGVSPATQYISGVAPGAASAPVAVPVATGTVYFGVTAAGTTTPFLAVGSGPAGKIDPIVPVAGYLLGGSDVSFFITPSGANANLSFRAHYRAPGE